MGIYDREYYRRDGPSFLGSLGKQGQVTNGLILLNVVCFLLQMLTRARIPDSFRINEPFTNALSLNVEFVLNGQVWRLLTYAFLHGSFLHILFNMLFLFWFGRQVEEVVGGREFLRYYLLSAFFAGLAFFVATLFGFHHGPAIGASGATTAVLVLAAFFNPKQVIYLFLIVPVPIWGFIILNVAMDAFKFLGRSTGVATSAHLGGAAFGYLYYKCGWRISGWLRLPTWKLPVRSRPSLKVYREEEVAVPSRPTAPLPAPSIRPDDEQLEAQVDVILEKIARVGMEGLTEHERNVLLRASEIMKRRRS